MPRFILHKHYATHLHYDLRLQKDGILKCFAIPKGISTKKGEKRLAIPTQDHNLEWLDFEGEIVEGYGKGVMKIFDKGEYIIEEWLDNKIILNFRGKKIKNRYALIKLSKSKYRKKSGKNNEWLIFKL